ncbi:hypothetical protein NYQ10_08675 [Flavobacterium johnsoniae]|uniref:hypothetical protein n=1 Tax=Flavobacterium johnsoniae TaxID=986 RepID=UPI0025AEDAD7|nr:hypothetical protein [Flavobacterium johnsoniae]WJS96523.1 hypothetical protein NYQ10_08675 [Flavobacterium johnsoniae]
MKLIIRFFSFLFCLQSFSQAISNQDKITKYLTDYFSEDREIIHVQFNKNIYTNNEDIGFKGYIFSKNNNIPNSTTTNVQLIVYNNENQIVQKQLLYAQGGIFSGGIHLNEKFKGGNYHFHFYTNWMNNFKEDDSFNQTIEIIDTKEPYTFKTNEPNWKTAEIRLFPEGGIILNDIVNTIGVKITDCNKKGIEITNGVILDSKSNEVASFHTNQMGNGVFYFTPNLNEKYTLKINTDKLEIEHPLDKISETGLILTEHNYPTKNNLIVVLKTNKKGLQVYQNKKFIVLIQQNGNSMQQEVTFNNNKTEQPIFFDKSFLPNGINTARVLDEDLNEITQRLAYIEHDVTPTTIIQTKTTANDSIILSGKTEAGKGHLSISILPEKIISGTQKKSILGTFYLNAYLDKPVNDNYFYFNPENKTRLQDIELLLVTQPKSKYLWENIKAGPPKITYESEKGITINGKVEKEQKTNSKYKISLFSAKNNLFEATDIDQNNDFKFEHFFVQDSTVLGFQMTNEQNAPLTTKLEARIARTEPRFVLEPSFEKIICPIIKKDANPIFNFPPPKAKVSELKEVAIKNTFKKQVFIHKAEVSPMARAFKSDDKDYRTVLEFISINGYLVSNSMDGKVAIYDRRSRDQPTSPSIYIDNTLIYNFEQLLNMTLNQTDEIYIDRNGISSISGIHSEGKIVNAQGTIKIFMKIGKNNDLFKQKYTTLVVTKGFAQNFTYKTALLENQEEFNYFGTLNWSPNIELNNGSDYQIKIPKNGQKEINVLLEGFTDEGYLISEVKKIPIGGSF